MPTLHNRLVIFINFGDIDDVDYFDDVDIPSQFFLCEKIILKFGSKNILVLKQMFLVWNKYLDPEKNIWSWIKFQKKYFGTEFFLVLEEYFGHKNVWNKRDWLWHRSGLPGKIYISYFRL